MPAHDSTPAWWPLTEAQTGLWYAQRLDPDNPIYNTGQYLEIEGPLDLDNFREAVAQALAEADALAIRVLDERQGPRQIVDETLRAKLRLIDLRGEPDPRSAAHKWMSDEINTPCDPTRDPLVCEALLIIGTQSYLWYQRIHHLVIDGYGTSLVTGRICDLYAARLTKKKMAGAGFGSFVEVLREDQAYRNSEQRKLDQQFWIKEFQERQPVVGLGRGRAITAQTYLRHGVALSESFSAALQALSKESGVTWPDILVALIAAYLRRHTGESATTVGVPTMNRMGTTAARTPAMIMNVLPIRLGADETAPLKDHLVETAKTLRRARRHGKYRSEQLRRDLGLLGEDRRLHGPLINILPFSDLPKLPGLATNLHTLGTGAVDDLTFTLRGTALGTSLHLEIDVNPNLFDKEELIEHVERLRTFLDHAVRASTLAEVPTLTAAEHRHWVEEINDTAHPVEDTTLAALIERTFKRTPQAAALVFGGQTLTYAELENRTDSLIERLTNAGVRRGDIVAVAAPRSFELVLALVAIIRAGAAYLPLDPEHPPQRIRTILESAQPRVALTTSTLRDIFPADTPTLLFDEEQLEPASKVPVEPPTPDTAAYVIYTSGSTGEPKGVVIEHRAIVNRLDWMRTHYHVTAEDRILQKTPATFDVSVWEFFLPLIVGATLVMAPPDAHKDPAWLASIVRESQISVLHFVPSMLAVFLSEPAAAGITLRLVFCSGEELPAPLRNRFHTVINAELHNLYGPTEAAVDVTYWSAGRDDDSAPVPIGFPVWNTRMYILDERLRPKPPETTGDLYIGGVQLAREYLNRPDLTAERFLTDPLIGGDARIYKTGDVARYRRDGAIVFLGRSDHQVKIRGQRIELGEIETAISETGAAARNVVIAREDQPGDQRIVAYLVPREKEIPPDIEAIRAQIAARLPVYMMPSALVLIAEIPVTRNGKLDRAALPAPTQSAAATGRMPGTNTEKRLAKLFIETLGLDSQSADGAYQLSAEDDFFALGGHSLLAARIMSRVREEWNCKLGLGALFANPTVAMLAAQLDALAPDAIATRADGLLTPQSEGLGMVIKLVRAERDQLQPLFTIHPAGGISWCYGGLGRALKPTRSVFGIQARGLDLRQPVPESLNEMADDYIEQIRHIQPEGPYHLAGWSVGGIIAQATAARLQARGAKVGVLAMLDSYPSDRWRNEAQPDESLALKALLYIAGHDPETITKAMLTREAVVEFLRRRQHPLGELSDDALSGVVRVVENNSRLVREHYHERYDGPLLYFRAALDHLNDDLSPQQWAAYVGEIEVYDLRFLHAQMIGPQAVSQIAPILSAHLEIKSST